MKRWIALLSKVPASLPQFLATFLTTVSRDPLTPALIIATTLHVALIVNLSFSVDLSAQRSEELAVTIALNPSAQPDKARHVAAMNQAGLEDAGGEIKPQWHPTTTMTLGETRTPESAASGRSLIHGSDSAAMLATNHQSISDSSNTDPSVIGAVAARQSLDAAYLAMWRSRVEEIGMMLAEEHRYLGEGDVRLSVRILANGELDRVTVIKTSGDPALDRAAQNTVVLAAPFPAFSAELANQTPELTIVRTWQFRTERGNQPRS